MQTIEEQAPVLKPHELFAQELSKLQPTGRLAKIERVVTSLMPKYALRREVSRRNLAMLRAQGAYSNRNRPNSRMSFGSEAPIKQRERRQLLWNAMELIDNSGLGESITGKYADYTFGRLRYQARTGDKYKNEQYEAIMAERCKCCLDLSRRHGLRTMMKLAVRGCVVKGGVVLRIVRPEPDSRYVAIQGIEYDRIGGLYEQRAEVGYADGIYYDPRTGAEISMRVYSRSRFGGYYLEKWDEDIPVYDSYGRRVLLHLMSPKDFDQYKGETAFKTVIDHLFYIDEIRKYELQALHMAATQSIIYKTKDGLLPRGNAYEKRIDPGTGLMTNVYRVGGNEVSAMEIGEDAKMFEHNRTSPNVIAAWNNTEFEICAALQMSRIFALGKNDAGGVDVRFQGQQTSRSIRTYFENATEKALDPIGEAVLGNEIAHDMSLYDPDWRKGIWIGPQDISIDSGYDSAADLNELAEGLQTESDLAALRGKDADEIRKQRKNEVAATRVAAFEMAQEIQRETGEQVSVDWCYAQLRRGQNASSGNLASVIAGAKDDPEKDGATSDGVEIDDGGENNPPQKALQREVIELRAQVAKLKKDAQGHEHSESNGEFTGSGGGGSSKPKEKSAPKKKDSPSASSGLKGTKKDADGKLVSEDGSELPAHISALKLPPAWTDVKVSHDPNSALQAQGKDAKGRVQSVYSDQHAAAQAALKFSRIRDLIGKSDGIMSENAKALQSSDPKEKDSAAALQLIHATGIRPGSDTDTGAEKQAYGATTLQGRHVVDDGNGNVSLQFTGKKGVDLNIPVDDKTIAADLLNRKKLAGDGGKIFAGTNDAALRNHVHGLPGAQNFKVKDFRTLKGTTTALSEVAKDATPSADAKAHKKRVMDVAKKVSKVLGNTPSIALESYIDPTVFHAWTPQPK